jgi:NhaA family Na+:H+ antiporter
MLLLISTVVALVWANSPWSAVYHGLWLTPIVNDGLMLIFFFAVGMEIRREIAVGQLSTVKLAILPIAAALGGMLMPALLYLWVAPSAMQSGWGIPMATDIAFALGILALLGKRVPVQLRLLLLSVAIIDDLGATLVIGLFYSTGMHGLGYLVAFFLGILVPTRMTAIWIERVTPWINWGILPLFALTNAGVTVSALSYDPSSIRVAAGIALGLVIGKPLGIYFASVFMLRLKMASLPRGLANKHLIVLGLVAGVGFTMSLLITQLAFHDPAVVMMAKTAVLSASAIAATLALLVGRMTDL